MNTGWKSHLAIHGNIIAICGFKWPSWDALIRDGGDNQEAGRNGRGAEAPLESNTREASENIRELREEQGISRSIFGARIETDL